MEVGPILELNLCETERETAAPVVADVHGRVERAVEDLRAVPVELVLVLVGDGAARVSVPAVGVDCADLLTVPAGRKRARSQEVKSQVCVHNVAGVRTFDGSEVNQRDPILKGGSFFEINTNRMIRDASRLMVRGESPLNLSAH